MSAPHLERPLYAQCWEDPSVLRRALRIAPGQRVLSVASAGDNSFALLLDDPRSVVAVDRNTTQIQVTQLKTAALRTLAREETLELLGVVPSRRREALLARVAEALPPDGRAFWRRSECLAWIRAGLVGAGKFERYLSFFRRFVIPLIHDRATVERLLGLGDREEQHRFYDEVWDSWRWRGLFRVFFGREVMKRFGRDPSFFSHVGEESIGDRFRERARWAFTELPVRENPYVTWILAGDFRATRLLPPYLQPGHYETIASRLDRLTLVPDELARHLGRAAAGSYDAFNLSDVFEYLSEEESAALFGSIARAGRSGARLCYWNLLVPRSAPPALAGRLVAEDERAARLHREDRAFFYHRLVIERVQVSEKKEGAP